MGSTKPISPRTRTMGDTFLYMQVSYMSWLELYRYTFISADEHGFKCVCERVRQGTPRPRESSGSFEDAELPENRKYIDNYHRCFEDTAENLERLLVFVEFPQDFVGDLRLIGVTDTDAVLKSREGRSSSDPYMP